MLLTWLPPANHSSPVDRYIVEFRLGERWEVLEDLIPATETELIARDLIQVGGGPNRELCVFALTGRHCKRLKGDILHPQVWVGLSLTSRFENLPIGVST